MPHDEMTVREARDFLAEFAGVPESTILSDEIVEAFEAREEVKAEPRRIPTYADAAHEAYNDRVLEVAHRLRRVADEVEERGRSESNGDNHVRRASAVLHALTWGVANTGVDALARLAGDADAANRAEQGDPP